MPSSDLSLNRTIPYRPSSQNTVSDAFQGTAHYTQLMKGEDFVLAQHPFHELPS